MTSSIYLFFFASVGGKKPKVNKGRNDLGWGYRAVFVLKGGNRQISVLHQPKSTFVLQRKTNEKKTQNGNWRLHLIKSVWTIHPFQNSLSRPCLGFAFIFLAPRGTLPLCLKEPDPAFPVSFIFAFELKIREMSLFSLGVIRLTQMTRLPPRANCPFLWLCWGGFVSAHRTSKLSVACSSPHPLTL